ncbi:hypothetical protein J5226_04320 [Lysobacter sp. K5869]|uniref:hypothetical protein n=1 Tax=Lysobacter sp. K5869 TaxID=2820808 RepID=UPI001C0602DB|nr:hypothetical protein [Lysobacter sp. K5869]QWP77643.1 hypothetical protein J5226_04320 [Lysobacter sp. K5869]
MRETPYGFHYSWSDLEPIRPLTLTVFATQLAGSALGYFGLPVESAFDRIWIGGAFATLPGYLAGCAVQYLVQPQRFDEHALMIKRFGGIAVALSVVALCVYWDNKS